MAVPIPPTDPQPSPPLQRLQLDVMGRVAPASVVALAGDWATAMAVLHGNGLTLGALIPQALRVTPDLLRGDIDASETRSDGALPYLAPEHSGRLARPADHRADVYALGVVLYELATGARPFAAADAGAMLHRHLTHLPPPAHSLAPDLPRPMSDLIGRMITKDPDLRPQSAAEILAVLTGAPSAKLDLPEMTYGQDAALAVLSAQVAAALSGQGRRLIRVTGSSGAGKSTLIAQLARSALPPQTRMAQGKFDQLDRIQPYAAFLAAFDMVLRQILSGSQDAFDMWRNRLLEALSPNGQVLLDILPRYQALIGPQPPVPALGLNEAQIRVSLVFRRFLAALAQPDAPLVLFLDDLQWADSASLGLIRLILSDTGLQHLALLVAYRDTEVGPDHPVQHLLNGATDLPSPILLRPLQAAEVAQLVADSLRTDAAATAPLAEIIARKTAGNPYFIRQFLLALARTGRIFRDPSGVGWLWDADGAQAEAFTENVVDLVAERILALPEPAQHLLRIASCMGSRFDTGLLARAAGRDLTAVTTDLEEACRADILGATDHGASYQFRHDRVQQAANAMLDAATRSRLHARLGALMLDQPEVQGSEVTDHLIAGFDDLDAKMRLRLRGLALTSAARSMASNAYEAAQIYYVAAARTVPGNRWDSDPALAFRVDLECAKIACLLGRIPQAEALAQALLSQNLAVLDRVAVLEVVILLHNSEVQYLKALQVGHDALVLLDAPLARAPGLPRVLAAFVLTKWQNRRYTDAQILDLPQITDPRLRAIMRVLVLLCPPAYFTSSTLLPLITLRLVRMSLRHGNAADSAYAYAIYGMLHALVLGRPLRALELAQMAEQLIPALGAQSNAGRILNMNAAFIRHWSAPLTQCLPLLLHAADQSLAGGDVETHGYCRYGHGSYALMAGLPLPQVTGYLENHLAAVTVVPHEKTRRIMTMALNSLYRMQGRVFPHPFDETENKALWTATADATSLAYLHKYKLLEALMQADFAQVLLQARAMKANQNGMLSMAFDPYYQFYHALALIHLSQRLPLPRRMLSQTKAALLIRHLHRRARFVPETHLHRVTLLRAELAAARGHASAAMAAFERAIVAARKAGSLHDLALGLERAGLFYLSQGATDPARASLQQAIQAYHDWGGTAWAQALAARHPDLGLTAETQTAPAQFDSETLLHAARALAETSSASDRTAEILRIIAQNAGAARGVLLLAEDGTLTPVAGFPEADHTHPAAMAHLVQRSGEPVLLDDARHTGDFTADPYVLLARPQSVLCAPLLAQGVVVGVIYLENPHLRAAFSPDRARTVSVLGAQAAVALQNARLLTRLQGVLERQVDMTSAHARFVPHRFLELLGRPSIVDVRLGDHMRARSSVLFADIRGFTPLIEAMPPDDVMGFVNGFLSRMEPPVREGAGFIDSIIGDAVMAVFDRGAEAGVVAGIAMQRALQDWQARAGISVQIGIGVATGELIFGTIGAANRLKCGVMGDTVNLAARIEGLTRQYGVGFLITDATFDALPDPKRFALREVDLVAVVGRQTPVRLYEVCDADPEPLRSQKAEAADDLAQGLALFRARDLDLAAAAFARAATIAPDDPVARLHVMRCAGAAAGEWTGVAQMRQK